MHKLKSINEYELLKNDITARNSDIQNQIQVKIAMATCAIASGSSNTMDHFYDAVKEYQLDNVTITLKG